jgi:hypothetical protein
MHNSVISKCDKLPNGSFLSENLTVAQLTKKFPVLRKFGLALLCSQNPDTDVSSPDLAEPSSHAHF